MISLRVLRKQLLYAEGFSLVLIVFEVSVEACVSCVAGV